MRYLVNSLILKYIITLYYVYSFNMLRNFLCIKLKLCTHVSQVKRYEYIPVSLSVIPYNKTYFIQTI